MGKTHRCGREQGIGVGIGVGTDNTCGHCDRDYVIKFGKDMTPLCQEHFDMVMKQAGRLLEQVTKTLRQ